MCRIIRRTELRRPPARQRLALIASREEGKLLWIILTDRRQPIDRRLDRFRPLDFFEFAGTAFANPQQRL